MIGKIQSNLGVSFGKLKIEQSEGTKAALSQLGRENLRTITETCKRLNQASGSRDIILRGTEKTTYENKRISWGVCKEVPVASDVTLRVDSAKGGSLAEVVIRKGSNVSDYLDSFVRETVKEMGVKPKAAEVKVQFATLSVPELMKKYK